MGTGGLVLAVVASVLGLALAQPGIGFWPLVFVCLVPLLLALRGRSLAARLAIAWVFGTLVSGAVAGWPAIEALAAYFELGWLPAALASAAVGQVFGALPITLFALLAGDLRQGKPVLVPVRVGVAWMASELVRGALLDGLPWMALAYSLVPVPELLGAASLGGAAFVSGWLAAVNASLALGLRARMRGALLGGAAWTLLVGLGIGLSVPEGGAVRTERVDTPGWLRVRLVQGNVTNAERRDPGRARDSVRQLAQESAGSRADLVVWPENAVSALMPANESLLRSSVPTPLPWTDFLLLGTLRAGTDPGVFYNTSLLLDRELRPVGHADKRKLFPFSEFTPWPFSRSGSPGFEVTPGQIPPVLAVAGQRLGMLVCYEILFAALARELVHEGAGLFVNLSNDSWFGANRGLDQHLAAAVLRAVEFQRPVLRATSTGITAAIDAQGRVVAKLPVLEEGALSVSVLPGQGLSLYARMGDAPGWIASLLVLVLALRPGRPG